VPGIHPTNAKLREKDGRDTVYALTLLFCPCCCLLANIDLLRLLTVHVLVDLCLFTVVSRVHVWPALTSALPAS
jgi:hypothetical protein